MKPFGLVYLIRCAVTGKCYVGITCRSAFRRWRQHVCSAKRGKISPLYKALRKHGEFEFTIETLEECLDRASLNAAEQKWIVEHRALVPLGYNLTNGGEGTSGYFHTTSTKLKISLIHKGRKRTAEAIRRSADALRGRKRSEITRLRLSIANRGKKPSVSTIEAARAANRGRRITESARAAISRQVIADFVKYESISKAAAALGVAAETISRRILKAKPGYRSLIPRRSRAKRTDVQRAVMRERSSMPVMADGRKFASLTEASTMLGLTRPGISYRIKVGKAGYSLL